MAKSDEKPTPSTSMQNKKTVDKSKKRKRDRGTVDNGSTANAAETALFSGSKDKELDDLFSKAPPAVPAPTASQPVATTQQPSSKPLKRSEQQTTPADNEAGPSNPAPALDVESESDTELVHESQKPSTKKQKTKSRAYVPIDETKEDKDRRTIFVGNLPIEVAKSKSALTQLRAHLLSFAPSAKIESHRFRSVAFSTPTTAVEEEEGDRIKREKARAAAWRAEQDKLESGDKRENEAADAAKSFIDAKGKRKVAFIKKDFHSELATCNAYFVFGHPHPDRPSNVAPIMNPFEAAQKVLAADGSTFLDRLIRVDVVRLPSAEALAYATTALGKRDAWLPSGADPKTSLFVGGLDYAAKEEDVRVFFEELVKAERGQPASKWVTGVRIVRDKATQLGKGFGYVHFADRESVDEMLALDHKKLKFAKKPLRLQQCKTLPTIKKPPPTAEPKSKTAVKPGPMPKGNPELGDKIRDLSKDERKVVKSADADRQARRMAKKKMKMAMGKEQERGAVKLDSGRRKDKLAKPKAKKGRGRSAHAISKMKGARE